jgi:hypothetical protein
MANQNPKPDKSNHKDCKVWWQLAYGYSRKRGAIASKIYARRVSDDLYTVWMEHCGARIAHCVTACCPTRAKAEFVDTYLIISETADRFSRLIVSSGCEDGRCDADAKAVSGEKATK